MALPNYLHTPFPARVGFSLKPGHGCSDNTIIRAMEDMGMKDNAVFIEPGVGQMVVGSAPDLYVVDRIKRCRLVNKCIMLGADLNEGFKLVFCYGIKLYEHTPRIYK